MKMRHIISLLMENEAGALSRVAGLFSARGYNIESLTVGPTEDPTLSRMTIVTRGSDEIIEQILKQLNKLIDVVKLVDLCEGPYIERELILLKLRADNNEAREEFKRLAEMFSGHIVNKTEEVYIIELAETSERIEAFVAAIDSKLIIETVRSGVIGISNGDQSLVL